MTIVELFDLLDDNDLDWWDRWPNVPEGVQTRSGLNIAAGLVNGISFDEGELPFDSEQFEVLYNIDIDAFRQKLEIANAGQPYEYTCTIRSKKNSMIFVRNFD